MSALTAAIGISGLALVAAAFVLGAAYVFLGLRRWALDFIAPSFAAGLLLVIVYAARVAS